MPEYADPRKRENAVFYDSLRQNATKVDLLQLSAIPASNSTKLHKVAVYCVSLHFVARQRCAFPWPLGRHGVCFGIWVSVGSVLVEHKALTHFEGLLHASCFL